MATKTFTAKTKGEWVQLSTLINFDFVDGKDYTLQVLGTAKFGDDGKTGILIDSTTPYTYTHKSGVDLYVMTENEDGAVITVSDSASLALATRGGGSGGGSGDAVWGSITGTLSDQTDLADALAAKQDLIDSTHKLSASLVDGLATVATSGSYADLTNTPKSIESVDNQNTAAGATTPLKLWEGTEQEWEIGGGTQTWYNWQSGSLWAPETSGVSDELFGIIYANNKFIAVGASGTILSSTDGSTWTPETSGANLAILGITYGNNKFIAVGAGGIILSSTDGSTWTSETSGVNRNINSVTYGNNKFIAVCDRGIILSSTDGSTWEEKADTDRALYTVCFGNNKFIAGGYSGKIFTSTDGSTWTSETSGVNRGIYGIIYANNKFIAVGDAGTILSSTDGSTWTSETSGVSVGLKGITYGNNKFIIVGDAGIIFTSTDGSTWTSETSGVSAFFRGITYANNKFIAVGSDGTILSQSENSVILTCYTTDAEPTTTSTVYSAPNTTSALTITAVGTGTITLSDTNVYDYNSGGNQTTTQSVGEAYPTWLCNVEGVGVKIGTTLIADYSAPAIGDIDTALTAIIAQGS